MKASIIMPTYNRAAFITAAIDSALQQSWKNIEIIVVDDGSTDETRSLVEHYDSRVVYHFTPHLGISHARNTGMGLASGECIAFLDSDDLYYPFKVELQVKVLEKFAEIGMVSSEASAFDDDGYWEEYHLRTYHRRPFVDMQLDYQDIYPESLTLAEAGLQFGQYESHRLYMGDIFALYLQGLILMTTTIMFRRSLLEAVGGQNPAYQVLEEYDFALRLSRHCRAAFIDMPTYKMRYHRGQISNAPDGPDTGTLRAQYNLLRIVESQALCDPAWYAAHQEAVDRRLAVLHRTLALMLLSGRQDAAAASQHLDQCDRLGYPDEQLRRLASLPMLLRKPWLKWMELAGK